MADYLYKLARLMQLAGLILLPIAIAGNLSPNQANALTLWQSLTLSGIGVCVFFFGVMLQQYAKPDQ
ncbi:MAG: hypothetical protein K2W96_19805 [Gemmataceae bacterium]|nr:hypothetical protein [Gemmataceae bacterium]